MNTLADLFHRFEQQARPDLLMRRRGPGFECIGAAEFCERTRRCAAALSGFGVGRGDRVGLICCNRPAWHAIDFACHLLGAVPVPLFDTLTPAQFRYIFRDSGCKVVLAEGPEQVGKVAGVRADLPALERLVLIREAGHGQAEPSAGPEPGLWERDPAAVVPADFELEELLAAQTVPTELPGPEGAEWPATIIYTSGTTGPPKGVLLTHGNLLSNVRGSLQVLSCRPVDRGLSVLPLCHSFQRLVDYTFFFVGAQIAYGSPVRLAEDYLLARPTVVAGVPRLFERFRGAVMEEMTAGGAIAQGVFRWAERVGRRRAEHELEAAPWGLSDRLQHGVADLLVLRKVRAGCGGRIYHFISGGAALDPSLNWWFESMGLRLLQGYGLTETSPVIAANPHDANRVGTVGTPIPGVEVRIADDGEILTRGPHVMKGYWNQPEATAEVIVDGWLHTGDIGELEDGYLSVTDRKKHMLVLSTGKNVAPQPLENALSQSLFVQQVAVVGDGQPFVAALIVPELGTLRPWAEKNGLPADAAALCADTRVVELIRSEIEPLQADFARFERVRDFRLLPAPFSIEAGTLTPTLKVVRRRVDDKYAELIGDIYREHGDRLASAPFPA